MVKNDKRHFEKRRLVTFYIRPDFAPVYIKFLQLIEKDERIKDQQYKPKDSLKSIAITILIIDYVKAKLKEEQMANSSGIEDVN